MKTLLITSFALALTASQSAMADEKQIAKYTIDSVNHQQQSSVSKSVSHQIKQDILYTVKTMQQPMIAEKERQLLVKAANSKTVSE